MRSIRPCIYQGFLRFEDKLVLQPPFNKVCKKINKNFKTIPLESMGVLLFFYNGSMMQLDRTGRLVIKRVKTKKEAEELFEKIKQVVGDGS